MTKPKTPVDSFGAEVFNALVEGSRRELRLNMKYRDAVRLRLRMHKLRAQMKEDSHPLYGLVLKAELRIEIPPNTPTRANYRNIRFPTDPNAMVTLIISPRDSDFVDVLAKAGVKVTPIEELPETQSPTTDLEALLKDLK